VKRYRVVDAEKLRDTDRRLRTSESEELRRAAGEVMAAIRELHTRGGVDDVFGHLRSDPGAKAKK
jgi:hypothetical protein